MHEHSLNGIVHVFAVFSALAGEKRGEAARLVEDYLAGTLGLRRADPSFGIFADLLEIYAEPVDPAAPERGVDGVCAKLDALLSPAEKQSFLLHSLHIRHALPEAGDRVDRLLARVADAFHVPEPELAAWRQFIAADLETPDTPLCRRFRRAGWRADVVVLHSPWTGHLFVRVLRGEVSLDENPLGLGRFHPLEPGAILRDAAGQAAYLCELARLFESSAASAPILFEAENLEYRFPGGGQGICGFSFRETGGRLIGVMGGSGTGKSTLVSLLNGSLPPGSGRVVLNGLDLYRNPAALEGVIGTVPQDDLLFEDLTVRENLDYNARLCLAGLTEAERRGRVQQMLRELHQEEIADLKVGDPLSKTISGGQRKRLNIALELIREPAVLFVDEPTSGLSSADSDIVMGLLKAQAARGRLVIAIIHQPSSNLFRLFDALWILDRGGVPVYMGHPLEAARHFRETAQLAGADRSVCPECGNVNPEQIFSIIESKEIDADGRFSRARKFTPEFWHDAWRKCAPPAPAGTAPAEPPPRNLNRPSWPRQLGVFFSRTLRARCANRAYGLVNLLEPPLLAFLTAGLCHAAPGGGYALADNPYLHVYFFMAVIVAIFLGLSVSAEEIVRDRRVLRRERFLHLSWSAYSGAKMLHVALLALLQTALCAGIGVAVLRLPGFFPRLWFALFSAAVFGGFLGLNVSARFKSAVTVYILLPLLLLPQMLLGGLIIAYDDLGGRDAPHAYPPALGELTASRWAFEALVVEQFQANAVQRHFLETDRALSRRDFLVNDWIPAVIGRLDALYLDSATPEQREETRALLVREFRALEDEQNLLSGADLAVAALRPPDRAGLEALKSRLRELSRAEQAGRQADQSRRNDIHNALLAERGEDGLAAFVKAHTNRKIIELVRNKGLSAPLRIRGGRLVQLSDPVHQAPDSAWGRAPFMAGEKRIAGKTFRTYGFDLAALWLMNAVLAAALAGFRPKT
ncbi:MAG: ATP-binding cassette domain-containing protein [Opitutae bacterium]|nr:ATP-binding cassette domain-containing protein [Opitutae bacterium]